GIDYDTAYTYLQSAAFKATAEKRHLRGLLRTEWIWSTDRRTAEDILGPDRLNACFDAKTYIEKGIEHIFRVNGF
ncbi:MAG: hypothetical protein AAB594_02350, partial [Patescibacteria group bacterium]